MYAKNTQQFLPIGNMIGCCSALLLLRKSAAQLALLTFVSIIVLVSPKWLNDWGLRTILLSMSEHMLAVILMIIIIIITTTTLTFLS